jgi:hypothetical protein
MAAFSTRWSFAAAALAAAVAFGGCGGATQLTGATASHSSALVKSIESFLHAISVDQLQCGAPGSHGGRSCQVEFTDNYGQWWATLQIRGSTVISDPGGVADWLCASSCANPPPMTGNTGNPKGNPGSTGTTGSHIKGQTGVTGIGGVVRPGSKPPKPRPPVNTITTVAPGTGIVTATGTGVATTPGTGVVTATGTGVGPGSGVVTATGTGLTGTGVVTGSNGVVYPPGSTGGGR